MAAPRPRMSRSMWRRGPISRSSALGGSGNEDNDIVIGRIARADTDGSEQITKLVLSGFLAGAIFKVNGVQVGALAVDGLDIGKWVITDPAQIASLATNDLVMTPRANDFGSFTLTTVASVTDSAHVEHRSRQRFGGLHQHRVGECRQRQ